MDYALCILDSRGRIASWNRGADRLKQYAADEIIGKHFSIFYPTDLIESEHPSRALSVAAAEGRHEDEGWRLRKGGGRFWASVVITALTDKQGRLVGFGVVTRDLTERKNAEHGLAKAYDQLNSILECTSDGVIKIDHNWIVVYGNRAAAEGLPESFVGKSYWDCFPGVRGTPLEATMLQAMSTRVEATYELFYSPYQKWHRGRVYPTDDGLSLFFADITERKNLEAEVQRATFLKEKRVEALGHMAGGLAHEINNPLAIIHATASDLMQVAQNQDTVAPAAVQTSCERIVKTTDRAIRILRGLKGFGRDSDKDPMQIASIYEIVDQCIDMQGMRFEHHKVGLRLELEQDLPFIECREAQIGQIVTNLLNNALDAIVHGHCEERWVLLSAKCAGEWLHVEVTDSGPGIGEDVKAHLMEAFFTTKENGLGMGIGLSLSKAIAEEHGGSLALMDGTTHTCFRLALPTAR